MYSAIRSLPLDGGHAAGDYHGPLDGTNLPGDACLVLTTDPKPRLRWTTELHERFVDAVTQLGGPDSEYYFVYLSPLLLKFLDLEMKMCVELASSSLCSVSCSPSSKIRLFLGFFSQSFRYCEEYVLLLDSLKFVITCS